MDYISRELATEAVIKAGGWSSTLDNVPSADVVERKTGKWKNYGEDLHVCSACHKYWIWATDRYDFKYCPNCGARMEGAE